MLSELWNFMMSFGKRYALYEVVVLSFSFFGGFPNLLVKYIAFAVFVVASGLFVPICASQFASYLRLIVAHRNRVKLPVSREIAALVKQMNVQVKELGFVKGCTAYVLRNSLVLGIELLKRLTFEKRQAVVAHELGHIKQKYTYWRLALMAPLLAIPYICWARISSPIFFTEPATFIIVNIMAFIAMLAYISLVMTPVNWRLEKNADKIAAKFVGKENIISALLALVDEEKRGMSSETHPSISERVKHIEELEL